MASDELVPWLRAEIEASLTRHRGIAAARRGPGCEGDELYIGARERAAQLETHLAILDEHYILWRHDTNEDYENFCVVSIGGADKDHGCVTCHYYGQGGVKGYGYCRTVRHLGWGYRFRPGYREEAWKP